VIKIQKKIVVDERGEKTAVIIPWKQFCEIAEAMGFDLDDEAREDLQATRRDWRWGKSRSFVPLSNIEEWPRLLFIVVPLDISNE
jgi:hypothetical protein